MPVLLTVASLVLSLLLAVSPRAEPTSEPDPAAPFVSALLELSAHESGAAEAKGWKPQGTGWVDAKGRPVANKRMFGFLRAETSAAIARLKAKRKDKTLTDEDRREAHRLLLTRLPLFPKEERRLNLERFLNGISPVRLAKSPLKLGVSTEEDFAGSSSTPSEPPAVRMPLTVQHDGAGGEPPPAARTRGRRRGFRASSPPAPPGTLRMEGDEEATPPEEPPAEAPPAEEGTAPEGEQPPAEAPPEGGGEGGGEEASSGWSCWGGKSESKPAEEPAPEPASTAGLGIALLSPALLERWRRLRRKGLRN